MSKVILVTGASSGLGFSISQYLASRGNIVYGTSRSIKEAQNFKTLSMDVCQSVSVEQTVSSILKSEGKIDVVVNNAGLGIAGPLEHLALPEIQKVFDTNLFGVLRVSQAVLPSMRSRRSGLIINISSIGSELGLPYRGGYSASKAALDRLSEALRMEVKKHGIQVCTLQPGGICTDINKNRILCPMPEDSPYSQSFDRASNIIQESVSSGLSAESFGPVIEKIINSKKVKRNYRVGKASERLSVLVKRLVPDYLFERIIMDHYKI